MYIYSIYYILRQQITLHSASQIPICFSRLYNLYNSTLCPETLKLYKEKLPNGIQISVKNSEKCEEELFSHVILRYSVI